MTATGGASAKTPWFKKRWVWITVGVLVLVGVVGNLAGFGNRDDDAINPVASEPPVTVDSPAPTTDPDDLDEAVEEVEPAEPVEEAGPSDEERAATFDTALRDAFGGATYAELLAEDPSMWVGYVNGIRVENSNVFVTLQIGNAEPDRDGFGSRAAQALSTLMPASAVDGISFIVVEDASGVVIDQKQPNPLT